MIRRSFIATVLIAAGLRKAPEEDLTFRIMSEEEVCVIERWERNVDGSYSYNLECGPDGTVRKINDRLPAGLRSVPYTFKSVAPYAPIRL